MIDNRDNIFYLVSYIKIIDMMIRIYYILSYILGGDLTW